MRYIGFFLLTLSVGAYMTFAYRLEKAGRSQEVCHQVEVKILDKDKNRLVSEEEILSILRNEFGELTGRERSSLNLDQMETTLNRRSAIRKSEIYCKANGDVQVEVTQLSPILRINGKNGDFFADENGYLFPYAKDVSSFVPVLSGHLDFNLKKDYRGLYSGKDSARISGLLHIARRINENPFWRAQIQQLYVDRNQDLILIPRIGNQTIVFGDFENIDGKFDKMNAFYKAIVPNEGWNKYSTVNVKYRNQIICK